MCMVVGKNSGCGHLSVSSVAVLTNVSCKHGFCENSFSLTCYDCFAFGHGFALGLWSFHIEVLVFLISHPLGFLLPPLLGYACSHWQVMSVVSCS